MRGYTGFNHWNKWSVILANLVSVGSLENHETKFTIVFSASFESGWAESYG